MALISYLERAVVRPLRQNQTLAMLCLTTAATMAAAGLAFAVLARETVCRR